MYMFQWVSMFFFQNIQRLQYVAKPNRCHYGKQPVKGYCSNFPRTDNLHYKSTYREFLYMWNSFSFLALVAYFFLFCMFAVFFIISWLCLYLQLLYCDHGSNNRFNSHFQVTMLPALPLVKLNQFLVFTSQFGCCEALCLLSTTFPVCTWSVGWHCGYVPSFVNWSSESHVCRTEGT